MNVRFTIGRKIGFGFSVLILFTLMVFLLTNTTLESSKKTSNTIIKVNSPSVDALQELKILVLNSKLLITSWVNNQQDEDPKKKKLIKLIDQEYPATYKITKKLSVKWLEKEKVLVSDIFEEITTLFELQEQIRTQLSNFNSYEDPELKFFATMILEDDIDPQIDKVLFHLDHLIDLQRSNTNKSSGHMIEQFNFLESVVNKLGLLLIIGGILIAFFTVRSIVRPVNKLKKLLLLMGKGIIPDEILKPRSDEIGEMSNAMNDLIEGVKGTTRFANEVGSGNFTSDYKPLSEEDGLGHALLKMRTDLHANEQMLEKKVKERTEEVVLQREELFLQKKELEEVYSQVTDSIKYAKRIQEAILPPPNYVKRVLPNSFILYKPKDIVSGDFYWIQDRDEIVAVAAIDCTGHGVPGAFMTIVGHNQLNQAFLEVDELDPAKILDGLNKGIYSALNQAESDEQVKDGMDAAMCTIDYKAMKISFAGAYNPLYIVRDGEILQTKGDKFPVGAFIGEPQSFQRHDIDLFPGDSVYIFSDGYADQFGGPKGKKFMYRKFRSTLLEMQELSMEEQKKLLDKKLHDWMGDLEQVDDILIIGIRF